MLLAADAVHNIPMVGGALVKSASQLRFWPCSNRQAKSSWPTKAWTKCCNRS